MSKFNKVYFFYYITSVNDLKIPERVNKIKSTDNRQTKIIELIFTWIKK